MLRRVRQSRFDNSRDAVIAVLTSTELLIIDDFTLEPMTCEPRDVCQLLVERSGRESTVVTRNRDTANWRAAFDDDQLPQSTVDRFLHNAHDLVIEGESYRPGLKPDLHDDEPPPNTPNMKRTHIGRRR
jgi:DNA replication protein DnaC